MSYKLQDMIREREKTISELKIKLKEANQKIEAAWVKGNNCIDCEHNIRCHLKNCNEIIGSEKEDNEYPNTKIRRTK